MQIPLNQRAGELEEGDKREKERMYERVEEWKESKQKAATEFLHTLPSSVLKFIIPSLLSHTQNPFPASIIPSAKAVPLVLCKTPLFPIADKVVPAQM